MTTTTGTAERTMDEIIANVSSALTELNVAQNPDADRADNPYADHELPDLVTGVDVYADNIPARSMAPASSAGWVMEAGRLEGLKAQSRQRKAANRDRRRRTQARRNLFDETIAKPITPNPQRLAQAWIVVTDLKPIIERIATEKRQWAARFLGDVADDLVQAVLEKLALTLAKSDHDLDVFAEAAHQLGSHTRESGRIPGDQTKAKADPETEGQAAERKHRKGVRRARKELMSMVNHWTLTTVIDLYREVQNLRYENLDVIDTIGDAISGVGGDPYTAHTKADRAPAMLGTAFTAPGQVDRSVLAAAISTVITHRRLDRLTELLLTEENRRTDGTVKWTELAEAIFMACAEGVQLWPDVQRVTAHAKDPAEVRSKAAKNLVRRQFAWLPEFVVAVIAAMDTRPIGYHHGRTVMASDLDLYQADPDPLGARRYPLSPSLRYATATDAAQALVEALGETVTGEDFVHSMQYA